MQIHKSLVEASKGSPALSILIPTELVGFLIGKGGDGLKHITNNGEVQLNFQLPEDIDSSDRLLTLFGPLESVRQALARIVDRLLLVNNETPRQSAVAKDVSNDEIGEFAATAKWVISQRCCGVLIGKGGAGIKYLNHVSGACVKVAHTEEYNIQNERLVYVRGTQQQVDVALQFIASRVGGRPFSTSSKKKWYIHIPAVRSLMLPLDALRHLSTFGVSGEPCLPELTSYGQPQFTRYLTLLDAVHAEGVSTYADMSFNCPKDKVQYTIFGGDLEQVSNVFESFKVLLDEWMRSEDSLTRSTSPCSSATESTISPRDHYDGPDFCSASTSLMHSARTCGLKLVISGAAAKSLTGERPALELSSLSTSGSYVKVLPVIANISKTAQCCKVSVIGNNPLDLVDTIIKIVDELNKLGDWTKADVPIQRVATKDKLEKDEMKAAAASAAATAMPPVVQAARQRPAHAAARHEQSAGSSPVLGYYPQPYVIPPYPGSYSSPIVLPNPVMHPYPNVVYMVPGTSPPEYFTAWDPSMCPPSSVPSPRNSFRPRLENRGRGKDGMSSSPRDE